MNAKQYYRSIAKDRNAWRDEMRPVCMACGHKFGWLGPEIHEILSRAQAPNAWGFRANYLLLDRTCHEIVPSLGHAAQLAIKKAKDPQHYDLQEWLRIRNPNAPDYLTEEDIRRAA